ncbi:MAG: hypothetical protein ACHQF4_02415 [Sphingobacteriales bacterium]|jgi:ribosome modulation factor
MSEPLTPYEQGQSAFNANKSRGSNPYDKCTPEHDQWANGWDSACDDYRADNME